LCGRRNKKDMAIKEIVKLRTEIIRDTAGLFLLVEVQLFFFFS
jgi:hypothetical protein